MLSLDMKNLNFFAKGLNLMAFSDTMFQNRGLSVV